MSSVSSVNRRRGPTRRRVRRVRRVREGRSSTRSRRSRHALRRRRLLRRERSRLNLPSRPPPPAGDRRPRRHPDQTRCDRPPHRFPCQHQHHRHRRPQHLSPCCLRHRRRGLRPFAKTSPTLARSWSSSRRSWPKRESLTWRTVRVRSAGQDGVAAGQAVAARPRRRPRRSNKRPNRTFCRVGASSRPVPSNDRPTPARRGSPCRSIHPSTSSTARRHPRPRAGSSDARASSCSQPTAFVSNASLLRLHQSSRPSAPPSARQATVTTADGRTFVTTDGGVTLAGSEGAVTSLVSKTNTRSSRRQTEGTE